MKNLRVGQFFSVPFKEGLQAGIQVSAAPETVILLEEAGLLKESNSQRHCPMLEVVTFLLK